jgi:TP901 family phage tail tape measure protein
MADSYLNLILRATKTGSGPADARRELAALEREIKATHNSAVQSTKAYYGMAQSLTQNSSKANVARTALGGLQTEMQAGRLDTQKYGEAFEKTGLAAGILNKAALQASTSINKLNADYGAGKIGAQQYADGVMKVQHSLDQVGLKAKALQVGIGLATTAVLAGAAAFVDAVRTASQFETTMNKIVALTNTTEREIGGMTDAVSQMSKEVGRGPRELAEGLYFVASSGFAGAQGLKVLEASAKASAAGLGQTKTIADAVTSTLNAYKLGVDQASRVTDVLIQIVKEGKGEPTEFAGALGRILPIASQAGVSFEQVGASMATMTRIGLSAEEAATALRGTLSALESPGKQARDALAGIGLTADEVRASIRDRGLLVTLKDLMDRTQGNIDVLDAIIPNVRALTGVLATAGSQGEAYAEVLKSMQGAAGSTEKAFATASDTMAFKLNKAEASFDALKISIANRALPALTDFFDTMAKGLNTLDLLVTANQRLDDAVRGVNEELKTSAPSFEAYQAGVLGAAVAAGQLTQQQADLLAAGQRVTTGVGNQIDLTDELMRKMGLLTEAQFNAARGAYGVGGALDESERASRRAAEGAAAAAKGNQAIGISAAEAAAQTASLTQAVAVMTAGYGGAVRKEMTDYNKKQRELQADADDLMKKIQALEASNGQLITTTNKATMTANERHAAETKLAAVTEDLILRQRKRNESDAEFEARMSGLQVQADKLTGKLTNEVGPAYVDNTKKIAELKVKYDEVTGAIKENADAHDEAMKRIVLDIAQQQLAQDGWTKAEIKGFTEVAKQMGVFDEKSATMTANVLLATGQLAEDQNPYTFARNVQSALDDTLLPPVRESIGQLGGMQAKIDALRSKTITITTVFHEQRAAPGSDQPLTGGAQYGGQISAPTWVGEAGPELFFPQTRGYVMDNIDSARLLRALESLAGRQTQIEHAPQANLTRGGDTIVINDRMALAHYYEQRRRETLWRSNNRMGG